jgi:nucleotide-binding universal stress UspA family protein
MFKKILIPLDGSPLSDAMITHVKKLLVLYDAEVVLLNVALPENDTQHEKKQRATTASNTEIVQHLSALAQELAEQGVRVQTQTRSGDPAQEILHFADQFEPSLIAMATHGRTGVSRWIRGSVAERVLRNSTYPLLLSNPLRSEKEPEFKELDIKKIFVPLDGSEFSASILPMVQKLAQMYESDVVLFHAIPMIPLMDKQHVETNAKILNDARELLEPYRTEFGKAAICVRERIAFGVPASEILDALVEEQADLVAMATHGRSGLTRWMLGSTAEQVLRNLACPLLVERPGKSI